MFGKDFQKIPRWDDVIKYRSGSNTPTSNPVIDKRGSGGVTAPDGLTDRERLDKRLRELMGGN